MLSDDVIRKSIYASIIASILVILLIEPILGIIGKIIIWLGVNLYAGFSNSIYRDAALGLREKYSFLLFAIIISLFIGILFGFFSSSYFIKDKISELKKYNLTALRYLIVVILIFMNLFVFFFIASQFVSFQMNASFNQRLTVLAPNITDDEYKKIKAKWASMKNRKDYEELVNQMEQLSIKKNIILPKLLWK